MTDPGGPAAALQEVAVDMQPLLAGGAAGPGATHQASWTTEDVKVPQNHHVNLHRVSVSSMSSEEELDYQRIANMLRELYTPVNITVVDYSSDRVQFHTGINNINLAAFLAVPRPAWAKVRWINCDGTSGDVLTRLADEYELHPLAMEDAASLQRIKADFYSDHLFVATYVWDLQARGARNPAETPISYHMLESDEDDDDDDDTALENAGCSDQRNQVGTQGKGAAALPRGGVPLGWHGREGYRPTSEDLQGAGSSHRRPKQLRRRKSMQTQRGQRLRMELQAPFLDYRPRHYRSLKKKEVMLEQISMFLCPNGVLLSFFQDTGPAVLEPIYERLHTAHTLLTESEDASFLMQAVLEACIDYSIPVFQAFARKVSQCEDKVLTGGAKMNMTYKLHVLYTDLIILLRSFSPVQQLITLLGNRDAPTQHGAAICITPLTKLYLADLNDQAVTGEQDLQSLTEHTHHLLELNLNSISHRNETANSALAILSALFLPCTFLTGIYGMNWTYFPELEWHYGYLYFWMVILACISLSLCIMWVTGLLKFAGLDRMRLKLRLMFGARKQNNKMRQRKQQRKQKKLF